MSEHIQAVFTQVTGQYRVNFDDGDKIYVKIPVSAVAPAGLNALLFTVVGLRSGRGQIQHRPGGRRAAVDCAPRLHQGSKGTLCVNRGGRFSIPPARRLVCGIEARSAFQTKNTVIAVGALLVLLLAPIPLLSPTLSI